MPDEPSPHPYNLFFQYIYIYNNFIFLTRNFLICLFALRFPTQKMCATRSVNLIILEFVAIKLFVECTNFEATSQSFYCHLPVTPPT